MSDAVCVVPSTFQRSPKKQGPRSGVNRLSRLTQALDLQDILTSTAKALKQTLDCEQDQDKRARLAVAIASAGRSWQGLQGEVMALRGQGKPKPVEARNATQKRKTRVAPRPVSTTVKPTATTVEPTAASPGAGPDPAS